MHVVGILGRVIVNGYERLLEVKQHSLASSVWVSALEPQWLQPDEESSNFRAGQAVNFEVCLRYVAAALPISSGESMGLQQPITESSHTVLVGRVSRIIDAESFDCTLGPATIHVVLERAQSLSLNQLVKVGGELASAG